jgi:hypothetical protein
MATCQHYRWKTLFIILFHAQSGTRVETPIIRKLFSHEVNWTLMQIKYQRLEENSLTSTTLITLLLTPLCLKRLGVQEKTEMIMCIIFVAFT